MDPNDVRREWAERSGEYSPSYYAYRGPDETSESIRALLEAHVAPDAGVLELGCSSGRHLAHLHRHGYENLVGVEVNEAARDVMEETYADLAAAGTFYFDSIENVVGTFADDQFGAVYTVETLQHLHPDAEWVFDELARITETLLVTVENEGGHHQSDADVNYVPGDLPLYYRDWNRIFTDLGFVEVEASVGERDTTRAFRAPDAPESA